ncbi:C-C motif chemokine 2-like [Engraulis encrasicolus]|uniref:C-C motif chemokine 2-like n=1 Tax=Engraulis encrasicolus TaxID=184585 RepID=UPI002FCF55A5
MRTVFITSLLALALIISASAAPRSVTTSACCPDVYNGTIPANRVASYASTRSDCAKKALVFTTVIGKEFCVDRDQKWVKRIVDKLDGGAEATP